MRTGQQEIAAGLLAAQQRFDAWWAERVRGARIPDELWALAVDMAGQYGLGRAVTVLGLDYYGLKRRLLASGQKVAEPKQRAPRVKSPPPTPGGHEAFVQLPSLGMSSPSCRIELQTPAGASLRMELLGASMADTMLLTRAIWGQQ
jgi:hypothetical protein